MTNDTSIDVLDGEALAKVSRSLAELVHIASPGIAFDTYVTLRAKTVPVESKTATKLVASISCGVLSAEIVAGECIAHGPLPFVELVAQSQFFTSFDSKNEVKLAVQQGTGKIAYKRGRLSGTVAAIDPTSIVPTTMRTENAPIVLPAKTVRSLLKSTNFSSDDPNSSTTGPISRLEFADVKYGPRMFKYAQCVTYDSLCGSRSQLPKELKDVPKTFSAKIVLPNRLLNTLLSFIDDSKNFSLAVDPSVSLLFKAEGIKVCMALSEYADIEVGTMISQMKHDATEGIKLDPGDVIEAVGGIISVAALDKEVTNLIVSHKDNVVTFSVKSDVINGQHAVACTPARSGKQMNIMVDARRFLNFVKPCRGVDEGTFEILHHNGRVILDSPTATFAFSVI
jgi:hypothetical protein